MRNNKERYHFDREAKRRMLAQILLIIEQADLVKDYEERNRMIYHALAVAVDCGFQAGIRLDEVDPDWPVIYIELPTGQVSWHVPAHPTACDLHTTEVKYERIHEYTNALFQRAPEPGEDRPS